MQLMSVPNSFILQLTNNNVFPQIPHHAFFEAAKGIRKQITPDVIANFQRWRDANGVSEA